MDITLFSTLNAIAEIAKQLKNNTNTDVENVCDEIKASHIATFFKSSKEEALALALLVNEYLENDTVSIRSVLESLRLDYTQATRINNNLKVFINRDLIYANANPRNNPLTHYTITPRLINAIYSDDNTILNEAPINSIPDILVQFQSKLRHQANGTISALELYNWTIDMHHKVGIKTALSEFIVSKKINKCNATLLTFICIRSLQHTNSSFDLTDYMESVELSFEEKILLKKSFKDRTHCFFRLQLLNPQRSGRFWTQYEFDLTNRCITLFEGKYSELEEECTIDELLDKVIKHGLSNMPDHYLKMLKKLTNSRH